MAKLTNIPEAARLAINKMAIFSQADKRLVNVALDTVAAETAGGAIDGLTFNAVSAPDHAEGLVFYDDVDRALSYYNDEADVTVNIAEENLVRVRNVSGVEITDGEVVYISGSTGEVPQITKAIATTTHAKMLGVATHTIENNSFGYVTTFGIVRGIALGSFSVGDIVYLSDSVAGGLTGTKPTYPIEAVEIGTVIKNTAAGKLFVAIDHVYMHELVEDTTPQLGGNLDFNGQIATTFASTGIDDNATAERLQLSDSEMTLGNPTGAGNYAVVMPANVNTLTISGSDSTTQGGRIALNGHNTGIASQNNNISFSGTSLALDYRDSLNKWNFQANDIATTGGITCAGFTSTGIDDNATGERLQLADTLATWGTTAAPYAHAMAVNDQAMTLSGGTAFNVGAALNLYGGTAGAGQANDISFVVNGSLVGGWDNGSSTWNFGPNAITTTGVISGDGSGLTNLAPEGTAVLSTGVTAGWVLQADGDDTSSWVVLGDLKADGTVPLTAPWDVGGFSITNVGALTCDALTSTGINDDATGKRIELTDTAISLGTASTSYFVGRPDDLSSMVYAGSTAANVGGAMTLNGATGSIQFKMDGSNALYNPNNGTGWNFYTEDIATAGIIYSNSLTTGNITASGGISVGSDIYSPDSTGYLRISGGVQDNGATLQLNSSGVGDPYDIIFWTNLGGGFKALKFDSSASTWDFQDNTIVQGVDTVWTGGANTGNKMGTATTNDFGWNDIMGEINVRGIGVTDPTWTQIAATGFWDYKFDIGDSCWINFHIPHDYVPGTPVYLHAHFLTDGTEVRSVKWQFDCVYANGFGQQEFPFATPTTTTAAGDPPGVAYTHMIVEDAGTSVSGMEVDGMLKAKVTRITNGGTDNTDDVFLLTADIHYQSTGLATKNKAPNFYT